MYEHYLPDPRVHTHFSGGDNHTKVLRRWIPLVDDKATQFLLGKTALSPNLSWFDFENWFLPFLVVKWMVQALGLLSL